MSNKETAVEWLFNNYVDKGVITIEAIDKALKMEKKQRINDIHFGHGISSNVNINYEAYFKLEKGNNEQQ